jgi:uncharacterized protein with PQ loop repeat
MSEILIWRVFLTGANVIGLFYSIPQMIRTWKTKSTKDIDTTGQILRLICSIVWLVYCIQFQLFDVGVSWAITMVSSIWTLGFKVIYEYRWFQNRIPIKDDDQQELESM